MSMQLHTSQPVQLRRLAPDRTKPGWRKRPTDEASTAAMAFRDWMQENDHVGEIPWANGPTYPYRDPVHPGTETGIWQFYQWFCDEVGDDALPQNRFAHALSRVAKKRIKKVGDRWPTYYVIPRTKRVAT